MTTAAPTPRRILLGDAIGLAVLLIPIALLDTFVPTSSVPTIMWLFVYIALAFISWNVWRMPSAPRYPQGWLRVAAAAVVGGLVFFAADVLVGRSANANLSLLESAERARGLLGFAFTVLMFPTVFFIAIAGTVKSAYHRWRDPHC